MTYDAFLGLAYIKGFDNAEKYVSRKRYNSLMLCYFKKPNLVIKMCLRLCDIESRKETEIICKENCPYMIDPNKDLRPQRNALRIEIFSLAKRCGAKLKENRIGGIWDDYEYCTFVN